MFSVVQCCSLLFGVVQCVLYYIILIYYYISISLLYNNISIYRIVVYFFILSLFLSFFFLCLSLPRFSPNTAHIKNCPQSHLLLPWR